MISNHTITLQHGVTELMKVGTEFYLAASFSSLQQALAGLGWEHYSHSAELQFIFHAAPKLFSGSEPVLGEAVQSLQGHRCHKQSGQGCCGKPQGTGQALRVTTVP